MEHQQQFGGGQFTRVGEEAAGEHLEGQVVRGLGEADAFAGTPSALTPSKRSYTSGTRTSRSGRAARASIAARSRQPKVGLRATKPSALSGGVRGTRAKLSVSPPLCRSG